MPDTTHHRLVQTLQNLYGDCLFARDGIAYPVVVFPALTEQSNDIDSILSPEYPRAFVDPATFAFYDSGHLAERQQQRTITNNPTYILHRWHQHPLKIEAKLGRYTDMMATCDGLDWELRDFAAGKRDDFPHRDRLHAMIAPRDILFDGRGRSAVIGVAALTVVAIFTAPIISDNITALYPMIEGEGNSQLVGMVLFTKYLIPFEVAAVMLLVAMIAGIVLAGKKMDHSLTLMKDEEIERETTEKAQV